LSSEEEVFMRIDPKMVRQMVDYLHEANRDSLLQDFQTLSSFGRSIAFVKTTVNNKRYVLLVLLGIVVLGL